MNISNVSTLKLSSLFVVVFLFINIGCSQQSIVKDKFDYKHPITFNPSNYVCYKSNEAITIDGKDIDNSWQKASWTKEFVDIQGNLKPNPHLSTKVKMLWDDNYFYFFAKMEEPHIWATLQNRDDIMFHDDDIEIFIDPDGDSHNYYELEWNAYNTLWDLILLRPYRVDKKHKVLNNWNLLDIKSAVHIEGTINDPTDLDSYWSIEVAIPWSALREFSEIKKTPNDGDQWRVNYSRVDWTMDHDNANYTKRLQPDGKKISENNWVWSPTGKINMHMPEMWGYVQFTNTIAGDKEVEFTTNRDEEIKWALWNMYWQQLKYVRNNGEYTNDISHFTIPEIENCTFKPVINTTPHYFEIVAPSCDVEGEWIINKDGKVYYEKSKED